MTADLRDLTVVVVSLLGGRALASCLRAIAGQGARCIAVLGNAKSAAHNLEVEFTNVQFVYAPGVSVPERRLRGVAEAHTPLVGIIEDTSMPEPGWCEAVLSCFDEHEVDGAGGPVRVAVDLDARYKALACTEYGAFFPSPEQQSSASESLNAVPVSRIPGNNLAYRRSVLLTGLAARGRLIEGELNRQVLIAGRRLVMHPGMSVTYQGADVRNATLAARFHHGQLYAGTRPGTLFTRVLRVLTAPALLLLLAGRAMRAMPRIGPASDWVGILPWILALESAWALGETWGYIAGVGSSLEQWH